MDPEAYNPDVVRLGRKFLSMGHNPPRDVDEQIPTFEQSIFASGGPGRPAPRSAGSWPWVAGSFTIGSGQVWNLMTAHFETDGTLNLWWLLRHNHSGSHVETPATGPPGGTVDAWFISAKGNRDIVGPGPNWPMRSIRGPGTVYLYGVGARKNVTGSVPYKAIAATGSFSVSALLRGYIV